MGWRLIRWRSVGWRRGAGPVRRSQAASEGSMGEDHSAPGAGQEVEQGAVWQGWLARWAAQVSIQPWVEGHEEAAADELLAVGEACAPLARLLARRPQARAGWVRVLRARIAAAQAQQTPPRGRIVAFVEAGGVTGGVTPAGVEAVGPEAHDLWVERYLAHNAAARAAAQSLAHWLAEQRPTNRRRGSSLPQLPRR